MLKKLKGLRRKFYRFYRRLRLTVYSITARFRKFKKRLLYPVYLFPIKLVTFSLYYSIKLAAKIVRKVIVFLFKVIIYPFRSFGNFFKATALVALLVYIGFSFIAIADYITRNYGHYSKFLCDVGLQRELERKLVRVIGTFGEGSGFFMDEDSIVTSFHVIDGEESPKVVLPNEKIITPEKMIGSKDMDIAILESPEKRPELVLKFADPLTFYENEPLVSSGYALGSGLPGEPTTLRGRYIAYRQQRYGYIQTDINLVNGMSGGPLLEQCGTVVGVNTMGLSGLSLFIPANSVLAQMSEFTDQDVTKIEIDTSTPEGVVKAFYTYIKARNLEKAFELISEDRRATITSYEEWTKGYDNTLNVELVLSRVDEVDENRVDVKLASEDWVDGVLVEKFFEGYWIVVEEEDKLRLNESNIRQLDEQPSWDWWYYWEDELEE